MCDGACPQGKFSTEGAGACKAQPGFVGGGGGAASGSAPVSANLKCSPGFYGQRKGYVFSCVGCPKGRYSPGGSAQAATACYE